MNNIQHSPRVLSLWNQELVKTVCFEMINQSILTTPQWRIIKNTKKIKFLALKIYLKRSYLNKVLTGTNNKKENKSILVEKMKIIPMEPFQNDFQRKKLSPIMILHKIQTCHFFISICYVYIGNKRAYIGMVCKYT